MAKHWKILGMSLLALIGVFAINAGAAQAKWLLLLNKVSVDKIEGKGTAEAGYLLSANGNKIFCSASTGTGKAEVSALAEKNTLNASAIITFTGCKEERFPTTCSIHSTGRPNGTIVVSVTGVGKMENTNEEEIILDATSKEFTLLEYLGEECPLNESQEVVAGSVHILVLKALQDVALHEIHILDLGLTLFGTKAELHMLDPVTKAPLKTILGSITDIDNTKTIAVHLCNLTGSPKC